MLEDAILKLAQAIEMLATQLGTGRLSQASSESMSGKENSAQPSTPPSTVSLPVVTEEDIKTLKDAEPKKRGRPRKEPEAETTEAKPRKRLASYAEAQEILLSMGANADTQEEKDAAKRNRKRVVKHFKEDAEKLNHLAVLGDDIWSRVIDYVKNGADDEDDDEV